MIAIILGLCFALLNSSPAFSQDSTSDGPPSQEEADQESDACKKALKKCAKSSIALAPALGAQWAACKAVRVCKQECRNVKKDCKQVARSNKKSCKDECKDRFGGGKDFRECKRGCKDEKKEAKQECRSEKRECKNLCRASFLTPECITARAATLAAGGGAVVGCAGIHACMNREEARAEDQQ